MSKGIPKDMSVEYVDLPDKQLDETVFQELTENIKKQGVLDHAIAVPDQKRNGYKIISGKRRWRAGMMGKLAKVPCFITLPSGKQTTVIAKFTDIKQQNLNPIEKARIYQSAMEDFGFSLEETADIAGVPHTEIIDCLKLLEGIVS